MSIEAAFPAPAPARRRLSQVRSLSASVMLQLRIIGALMMRDGSARFGHENLGFFWMMGEPLVLTGGVMIMWYSTGMGHGHGVGLVPFALSGYSCLTLWRHVAGAAAHKIRNNVGLLFHRNIRVLDIMIARTLLEMISILTAFFIAYTPLALLGFAPVLSDPLLLFAGYMLHGWFSFGAGLIIAAMSEIYEAVERFVAPLMYITLPITGAFYLLYWLPESGRKILIYSPLVNSQEMFRGGLFPADIPTFYNVWYLIGWCLVLTAIGLPLISAAQKHVTMQ